MYGHSSGRGAHSHSYDAGFATSLHSQHASSDASSPLSPHAPVGRGGSGLVGSFGGNRTHAPWAAAIASAQEEMKESLGMCLGVG